MNIRFLYIFLLIFGCGKGQSLIESNNNELNELTTVNTLSIKLDSLPKSQYKRPICIDSDFDEYWQMKIDDKLRESKFQFYDYFFDTIVDKRQLAFTFRCVGGESINAIHARFFNEFNELFSEMLSPEYKDSEGCFYLVVADSIELNGTEIIYKRQRSYSLGGQSQTIRETFLLNEIQLKSIVNSVDNSKLDAFELVQYKKK